jgi:hypothetical protein
MTGAKASGTAPSCITYPSWTLLACAGPLMSMLLVIVEPHGLVVTLSCCLWLMLPMFWLQLYAKANMSPLPVSRWPNKGDVMQTMAL